VTPDKLDRLPASREAVRVRRARQADAAGIARVHVESWRDTYRGIIPAAYLANLSWEQQTREWRRHLTVAGNASFVAESDRDGIVGFANGGPERSGRSSRYFAEIYVLYLLKEYQRQGLGRDLVAAFAREIMAIGLWSMVIWVLAENTSRSFYEALGGEPVAQKTTSVGGARLIEVAYGWRDVRPLVCHSDR
jgi:ribosomal protein S18 acetylase RimI-like enzyme